MNIAFINGSPKIGQKNNSGIILQYLRKKIMSDCRISEYNVNKKPLTDVQISELGSMDVMVIAFPLYSNGIPSHLLQMMVQFEDYIRKNNIQNSNTYLYVIANNGFYEGKQNSIALQIMKNWCNCIGFIFGQGIGVGAGEMIPYVQYVPLGYGPLKNLGKALAILSNNIINKQKGENILFSPNLPYWVWHFMATHANWNKKAKRNGLTKKDIDRKG